ncbi:uncharacterized protein LOC117119547 [Anneissia japonica]|uniref:uncharacterized protein LOC117119547 n=1 Tax=Anneissia japonica TaxID=1529436 RepID=UPI0014255B79|nr:uncharacterized protein LOC117119547 [Anneissia japonica]
MDTHGNKNFNKLAFILLDIVTEHLRNIFRQEWDTQHPSKPWKDDKNSLLYLKTEANKLGTWKDLKAPMSGDLNEWDPTNLFYALLYSKTITIMAAHRQQIDKLRQIRNKYIGHHSRASISNTAFKAIYQDIEKCMIGLNCSSYVQKQMEDVKNEIIKVPEDYMKGVEAKLDIIKRLLMQSQSFPRKYGYSMLILLGVMMFYEIFNPVSHPTCDHIDMCTRTTCSNSRSFFPESRKPSYYIGHDDEINTGVGVLANGSYPMVSITGPPAIGKTATAAAVGQVLKNNHGYQVAFIDFKQINVSSSCIRTYIYKDIVLSIDFELEIVPNSVQEFKLLMIKLTTCPTLLIFDNIENILNSTSKSLYYEVTKLCLAINKIKILTTSRKDFDIIGVSIYPIKLEPLPISQSTGVLVSLLPGLQQKRLVKIIAEKTGGIPLLLEVAASLVRSKYYEEAELLNRLEELPILVVLNDTKDMTESSNYYKLLKILFDGLDPSLQNTFIAFGIFLDRSSTDTVVNLNFSKKVDLYPLVNYNLLKTFDIPSGQRLYGMHPVVSEFTRLVAKDNSCFSKIQHTMFGSCYMTTNSLKCGSLSFIMADHSNMTLQQPIWEHNVQKILVHYGLTERDELWLGIIAFHLGLEFYDLGQYTESIDYLHQAIELIKEDNNQFLKCLANFAVNATAKSLKQGKLILNIEFSNLLLRTLKLIKTDPCFVATSLLDLGILSNNMMFQEYAVFVVSQALTYYKQQYQNQNCSKENLVSLSLELGATFYNHGKYHGSINVLLKSASLLKSHDDQLMTDWLLADSYYKTQDYESCFQIVQRVLNSSYEVDYHKQKHVFQALTDLALKAADTYISQSNINMTIQFSILSLNTLKMLETDSCFISSLYFHIGLMFYNLGTFYRHAAFAFNQTWTFLKMNECGEEDLGLVAFYLGGAYYHCGQYNDSIDVLRKAVDLLEKDDVHQFMANCFLAFSYYEIQEHETCCQITKNILSNNSYLNTLNSSYLCIWDLVNLANISVLAAYQYIKQGKLNQSIDFNHLSIVTLEMVDESSCLIASQYCNLSLALFRVQRHADAAIALNKALELFHLNGCDEERVGVVALYAINTIV